MSAAEARALVKTARVAALATLGPQGSPLTTLVAVTDDGSGRPLFLLSGLAEHTRNLRQRPQASLLVHPHGGDSLDRPRVTLSGTIRFLEGQDAMHARSCFEATHPEAKVWLGLPDFSPARLELETVRFVGGFARAAPLTVEAYLEVSP